MFNSAAMTGAASTTSVGYEFTLPVSCDSDEVLTITVEWVAAVTTMGANITAYSGVFRLGAEVIPVEPEVKVGFRHHMLGASGVIAAGSEWSLAPINKIDNFALAGFMVETNTTARGTLTNALNTIQLTNGVGNYLIDENAGLLRHIFGLEILTALPTGIYYFLCQPFMHDAQTSLNLAATTATVDGSQVVAIYVLVRSADKTYTAPIQMQTKPAGDINAPPAPSVQPNQVQGPQPQSQNMTVNQPGGRSSLMYVPAR
jgi:hypothetical protein